MKGALVFVVLLAATPAYPSMPPRRQLYDLLGTQETDYLVLGVALTTLVVAIFNSVIYGVIAWLIHTSAEKARKPKV